MEAHGQWGIHGGLDLQGAPRGLFSFVFQEDHLEGLGSSQG